MKIMMVESRYKGKIDMSKLDTNALPKKLGIVTTVQFLDYVEEFKKYLTEKGKEVFVDMQNQKYPGQLLGCDQGAAVQVKDKVDAFLYIGTGKFHPLGIGLNTNKDVYCYDPITGVSSKLDNKEIENYNKRRKGAYLRFLNAKEIGFLVSLKPGQNQFKKTVEWKEKLKKEGKNCYIFAFDSLDFNQIENFPFVECWVNTACNRILDDYDKFPKPIIDIRDIEKDYS